MTRKEQDTFSVGVLLGRAIKAGTLDPITAVSSVDKWDIELLPDSVRDEAAAMFTSKASKPWVETKKKRIKL